MRSLRRLIKKVKEALGIRAQHPRCGACRDQLLLEMEVEQGLCIDCQQPTVERKVRPLGKASSR